MSNGRILTQAEMDRAHLSQLEAENAVLEWKHLAAEANAQISIAAQANWRIRALAAEANAKALEGLGADAIRAMKMCKANPALSSIQLAVVEETLANMFAFKERWEGDRLRAAAQYIRERNNAGA